MHDPSGASRLTGSARRLLAVLVAAGSQGRSAERIADGIWAEHQPDPWRPALRMAVARLRKQLPASWDVISDSGGYRLDPGDGWIDAWRLAELAASSMAIGESDLEWILAGEPYPDLDVIDPIGATPEHLGLLQLEVVERFCSQRSASLSSNTCSALSGLLRQHPYNDRLAVVVARCLVDAGRQPEARAIVSSFAATFREEFGAVPEDLMAVVGSTFDGDAAAPVLRTEVPLVLPLTAGGLPKELRHIAESVLVGRNEELNALGAAASALVVGATGSGKSRLLAELIMDDAERRTTYVVGDDGLDLQLGAFVVAVPSLRDALVSGELDESRASRDDGSEERAASTRAWRIVLAHFENEARYRPQRLIVDDAHLLDHTSLGLLRLLIRSNTSSGVSVVVSGRSDVEDAAWVDFQRDARRAGTEVVELIGLDLSALESMVAAEFPDSTRELVRGLALDVLEASGGLPAVAVPLIESADRATLVLPEHIEGTTALGSVASSLSASARDIAAGAAVLGLEFSIGTLISLLGLPEDDVFRGLDEMWASKSNIIDETDDPDRIRFRHLLMHGAFIDVVPMYRRSQLHRLAAGLTNDPHERARHQASAGSLVAPTVAAQSLIESAGLLARNRQWRRAARQLRRVESLVGTDMDASSLTLWATALDRSGADGVGPRRAAYRRAQQDRDWEAAFAAATAGLPEAERPDGDPERIEMLEGIPSEALAPNLHFDLVLHLARQYAVGGRRDRATTHAENAIRLATEPDDVALSHVVRWTATRHVDPSPHVFPELLQNQGTLSSRTRMAQMSAIGAVESGHFEDARRHATRFDTLASELGDPLRMWQSMVLQAMFAFDDGALANARSLTDQATEFAQLYGLQQGWAAWLAQTFHLHTIRGRAAELWPTLKAYRANVEQSAIGLAAIHLVREAANEAPAEDELRAVLQDALDRQRTSSLVVLALLCPLVHQHATDLVPAVRARLEPFAENSLVIGYGVANLGPAMRYLAELAESSDERTDLIRRSVDIADRHGSLLWRVLNRVSLAEVGEADHRLRAMELAEGTALEAVVARPEH